MNNSKWIWYPGDFEIYHAMLQHFQREERGFGWPAYWKLDDCRRNIHFSVTYNLDKSEKIVVHGIGIGYVRINDVKFCMDKELVCEAGKNIIEVFIGNPAGLPCIYVTGETINSDENWQVDDFVTEPVTVGTSELFIRQNQNPNIIEYKKKSVQAVSKEIINNGILFDFGMEVNGTLLIDAPNKEARYTLCYGESADEALDVDMCYYKQENVGPDTWNRKRAFRFVFIPGNMGGDVSLTAVHEYLHKPVRSTFECSDEQMNQIWATSVDTFLNCCGVLILEGAKRDRWLWSGDAYQSYFVNQYLQFDTALNKRMIVALRGQDAVEQHMNTIVDYSLLWIISIGNQYLMGADSEFIKLIYPKMRTLMDYCINQTDEHGFIYGREKDWIFIDWSDIDKDGTISAEQLLLLKAYQTMVVCGNIIGADTDTYEVKIAKLKKNILKYFWDEDLGAFIDSYKSGKRKVTRHANIFAVLFDAVDSEKAEKIVKNVLFNEKITKITTPYFKFFELDALGKLGYVDEIWETLHSYWGGMLKEGAVTFWEEYIPGQRGKERYGMYGDPYGKSLCHAWGASPIYLIGRYICGVYPLTAGYETFAVEPKMLDKIDSFNAQIPVNLGQVTIKWYNNKIEVVTDRNGGILIFNGKNVPMAADKVISLEYEREE